MINGSATVLNGVLYHCSTNAFTFMGIKYCHIGDLTGVKCVVPMRLIPKLSRTFPVDICIDGGRVFSTTLMVASRITVCEGQFLVRSVLPLSCFLNKGDGPCARNVAKLRCC